VSGTAPVWRESDHLFFALGRFEPMLREWVQSGSLQESVRAKLDEWFSTGLQDWDILARCAVFGFEIPGIPASISTSGYDAPIGYLGSFKALCERRGLDMHQYLAPDSATELHHFIGKDISYFHTLFWRAVLHGSGFRRPTAVHVHGFLTINGQKMSKSRGTFISRPPLPRHCCLPEPLRYYFAGQARSERRRHRLVAEDFTARVDVRPRRQAGEHRQPLRRFRHAQWRPAGVALARPWPRTATSRPPRRDVAALYERAATTDRPCARSCCLADTAPTSTVDAAQALGARQGPRAGLPRPLAVATQESTCSGR
jgi:hypothetical protein